MPQLQQRSADAHPALPRSLDSLLSPALVILLDRARANIERMLTYLGGDRELWRPHLKTSKIPEVWQLLLDAGIRRFKCATTREAAEMLALLRRNGIEDGDLLIAYPLTGPSLDRAAALARDFGEMRISFLVEDLKTAREAPRELGRFIDLDPGMHRTGVPVEDRTRIETIARACGEQLRGLHFYDGHIRDGTPDSRRQRAHGGYAALIEIDETLRARGVVIDELITCGTPTFLHALAFEPFDALDGTAHRISPGTIILHDFGYAEMLPEIEFEFAGQVMSRVISRPNDRTVTVDAGSKAIAAEAGDPCARALDWPNLVARKPSEEHLPFDLIEGDAPKRGEMLLLIPRHICPTVNLADRAVLVDGDDVVDIVPVAARGHDL